MAELDTILVVVFIVLSIEVVVGFNRRFSPHIQIMKELTGSNPGKMNVVAKMNAGHMPQDS